MIKFSIKTLVYGMYLNGLTSAKAHGVLVDTFITMDAVSDGDARQAMKQELSSVMSDALEDGAFREYCEGIHTRIA